MLFFFFFCGGQEIFAGVQVQFLRSEIHWLYRVGSGRRFTRSQGNAGLDLSPVHFFLYDCVTFWGVVFVEAQCRDFMFVWIMIFLGYFPEVSDIFGGLSLLLRR